VLSQSSLCLEGKTGFSCTLIAPTICRRFIKPTHHEIVEFSWKKKAGLSLHIWGYIDPIIEDILNLGVAALSLGSPSSLKRMIGISQKKIFQVGKTASPFFVLGTRKKYSHWFKSESF